MYNSSELYPNGNTHLIRYNNIIEGFSSSDDLYRNLPFGPEHSYGGEEFAFAHTSYLPSKKILLTVYPKGGTTTVAAMVVQAFNIKSNFKYLLDAGRINKFRFKLSDYSFKEQQEIINNPHTQKILVWRDNDERLLSAWKSKLRCVEHVDEGDWKIIPSLLKAFDHSAKKHRKDSGSECIPFDQYVDMLKQLKSHPDITYRMNNHLRLATKYHEGFHYNHVIELKDLGNENDPLLRALGISSWEKRITHPSGKSDDDAFHLQEIRSVLF